MIFPRMTILALCTPLFAVGCGASHPDTTAELKATATAPSRPGLAASKAEPAPTATPRPMTPKPDAMRLKYDASTRTLAVYEPPVPGARWMLSTVKEPRGVPVEATYQFPPMVDLDGVSVFYTASNGKASQAVSLREIVEAREIR